MKAYGKRGMTLWVAGEVEEAEDAPAGPTFKGKGPATTPQQPSASSASSFKKPKCPICKSRILHEVDDCHAIHAWKAKPDWKYPPTQAKAVEKARKEPKKRKLIEESKVR